MVLVLRSFATGPLGSYASGFAQELVRQGYTVNGGEQHLRFVAHLNRWMLAGGLTVGDLSGPVIEQYLAERRAAGYVRYRTMAAMRPLLAYLAPLGVLPPACVPERAPAEDLLDRYGQFLILERRLSERTVRGYVDAVRPFVAARAGKDGLDLAGLTAGDVTGFVLAACPHRAVGSAKLIVTALRSLLSWLHLSGAVPVSLAGAVPAVAGWRMRAAEGVGARSDGPAPGQLRPAPGDRAPRLRDLVDAGPAGPALRRGRRAGPGRHRLACG